MATILVVDERPSDRHVMVSLLGAAGHRVMQAPDGSEALECVRVQHPDLVLTALIMPTMDGYEFVYRLHADPATARTPVIFCGDISPGGKGHALAQACGVQHVISKPCEPAALLGTISAALSLPAPAEPPPSPEQFGLQHVRLLTSELAQKVDELDRVKASLAALVELSRQTAYRNTRAEHELRHYTQRLEAMREIDRAILAATSPEEIARAALVRLRRLVPCQRASVLVFDFPANQGIYLAVEANDASGLGPDPPLPLDALGDIESVRPDEVLVFEDIRTVSPPRPLARAVQTEGIRSGIAVPLFVKGELMGSLNLGATSPGGFNADHVDIAREVAYPVALSIHQAWLFEQVQRGRQRLQALWRRLLKVQETERRVLARELHDEIGQLLTALQLVLERSARQPPDAAAASLGEARAVVHEVLARVREMSVDLRPPMLDDLGLVPTLVWYCDLYTARTGVRVTFKNDGVDRRFPPDLETAAYRIVQECLTNVARHARASVAQVRLWADAGAVRVQVEDPGAGFDVVGSLPDAASSGLVGMRERAQLLGGQLTIESTPGSGTRVTAELPLGQPLEKRPRTRRP
ncbi:MAG TPA: response regulator [Gemmataceae bacterium]|jgi:signal transduction histidine kinase/FixJ family two-component response regulator|nr:response regulator [Gemmataceae bacterium]